MDVRQKINEIEDELRKTQKNKATEYHIGLLKAKLAKLRRELTAPKKAGGGRGFSIRKEGDATVVMVGPPSVGKSTLLTRLTNARSKIAPYAFTTVSCIPGMLEYMGAYIQLLDLPGIIEGAMEGKGRGREVVSVVRSADLILIICDVKNIAARYMVERELEALGIRLNKRPPDIMIKKLLQGGISITAARSLTKTSKAEIIAVLNEYGIYNANVLLREDISLEELTDVLEGNRIYIPAITVVNKIDLAPDTKLPNDVIAIAADAGVGLETLKSTMYEKLGFMRIYTKKQGKEANLDEPIIMKKASTIGGLCEKVHRDLKKEFRYALVWGSSVKHQGQRVGMEHVLADGDIVCIVKK